MSNITIFERKLPLRAYPQKDLDTILNTEFKFWLATLLGLKEDREDAYDITIDAIKKECIGMGFVEIKKMFEMYVDNKLHIKPIPNYFDRILFGKIIESYTKQKPKKTIKIENKMTDEEKEITVINACFRIFEQYKENGEITDICIHVYDYLFKKDMLPKDRLYKDAMFTKATLIYKSEKMQDAGKSLEAHRTLKSVLASIENGNKKSEIIPIAKRLVLEDYFSKIDKLVIKS